MRFPNSAKYAASVSAVGVLLAACTSNGGSSLAPTGNRLSSAVHQEISRNQNVDLSLTPVTPPGVKPQFHRVPNVKLIKPNCCALTKTLFVVDGYGANYGEVDAFTFPAGVLLGSLPAPPEGWAAPIGACADKSGNVYIANIRISTIDEYSHSGAYIATLADPGQYPATCAYDRTTGNLAVANELDGSGGPGSISIYHGGVLQHTYVPSNMSRVYFVGYEGGTGRLWLDGSDSSGFFQYDSFRGGEFTNVGVHGTTIGFPGMVQWSAKTKSMNVGDQDTFSAPTIYQVSNTGQITGATVTQCASPSDFCDIAQGFIKGSRLVAPDSINDSVSIFPYPAGGQPEVVLSGTVGQTIGSVVSPDKGSGD